MKRTGGGEPANEAMERTVIRGILDFVELNAVQQGSPPWSEGEKDAGRFIIWGVLAYFLAQSQAAGIQNQYLMVLERLMQEAESG